MSQKMSKKDLIGQIRTVRTELEALFSKMSEKQMEMPGVQGNWSVKDIIAHITTWDRRGTKWIQSIAQGEEPQIPKAGYTWRDQAQLNQETYQKNRNRPIQDILGDFHQSFPLLMEQIEMLAEEQLEKVFQADWTRNNPISARDIVAWRYLHYQSHIRHIQAWQEAIKSNDS
ncbi:MAG: ClbS/DfsB family four-helix bundle protein [Candidatus Hodarchaeota archaeon]